MALVLTCLFGTTACIEDDFTSSSADLLEFSCDTVAFDTVFTELGTPTKQFVIYNRHKKMINISSISLQGNAHGRFFLNVDGMKGFVAKIAFMSSWKASSTPPIKTLRLR